MTRARALTLALAGVVALWLLALNFGALGAVALRAEGLTGLRAADWAAVRFTVLQAFLSALLSVALAIPVARALARRQFAGRGLLITLMGAPFILPTLVAVLGLLAVFGRSGLVNEALALVGLGPVNIYGLHGVVLAHVFYNLPLATRIILQGWATIPAERVRLAVSLGFTPSDRLRHLEAPMLREVAPGAFLLVFLICLTSFAVALALGGGPRATTVELAIYQAFRFDYDMGRAAALALVQFALCLGAGLLALRVALPSGLGGGLDRPLPRLEYRRGALWGDSALIACAALFLLVPLALIVARGAPYLASLPASVWQAALRSLWVALGATALTTAFALVLAHAILALPRAGALGLEWLGLAALAASPLVIGTGLFLIIRPIADPRDLALAVTMLVNAGLALPFALRLILPALRDAAATQGRLATSLGLHGFARLRLVTLPRLRRPLGFAAGLTAALSMGDLGVILLFAEADRATLPMQLYRLMQAYRQDEAAGAALLLLLSSLALFWAFDRWGRADAAA
ncbi:Sulfate transport system permease protein CysW [Roseibaca ekhonensis]|uniref:Sulfate transport system permease protein CysW n=1 Tax=Roseinatronobacter ekhonensis TaxID=254356 RepID=A0A3B0M5V9_9RHOB|nr:Sulfate transport system permease protein CysW [Roseibaca ekhonensis]